MGDNVSPRLFDRNIGFYPFEELHIHRVLRHKRRHGLSDGVKPGQQPLIVSHWSAAYQGERRRTPPAKPRETSPAPTARQAQNPGHRQGSQLGLHSFGASGTMPDRHSAPPAIHSAAISETVAISLVSPANDLRPNYCMAETGSKVARKIYVCGIIAVQGSKKRTVS